jgi:hypothetical protein
MKTLYKIVEAPSPYVFMGKVEEALQEGWKLQGGVSTTPARYFQALVKEVK